MTILPMPLPAELKAELERSSLPAAVFKLASFLGMRAYRQVVEHPKEAIAWAILVVVFAWTYWTTLERVVRAWATTPDYGHGFVVPIFAAFLLWLRKEMVDPWPAKRSWWALAFFAVWALMRWAIAYFGWERDMDSLFPFLIGLALFLGGWRALHWAWPAILFLVFMVPLPASLASALSGWLQGKATFFSVFTLQTLGVAAIAEGNEILLSGGARLEVANVCSGLRMLMLFFAVCVGASFVVRAAWWEKAILIVSAAPIALVSNVARISLNGILTELVSPAAGLFVEDNGWAMMILAMLLLWGEIVLVSKLLPEVSTEGPLSLGDSWPSASKRAAGNGQQGNDRPYDQRRRAARR